MFEISYSYYSNHLENKAQQRVASDFSDFCNQLTDNMPNKKSACISGPMSFGVHDDQKRYSGEAHFRLASHALSFGLLMQDADKYIKPEALAAYKKFCSERMCLLYTSGSHSEAAPRTKAIFVLTRPVSREERIRLGQIFEQMTHQAIGENCIDFDNTAYRSEQLCYLPLRDCQYWVFEAEPIDVDALLANQSVVKASKSTGMLDHLLTQSKFSGWPPEKIQVGERNNRLLSFIGHLRVQGYDSNEIRRQTLEANQTRFEPPLPDLEVFSLLARYGNADGRATTAEGTVGEQWGSPEPLPPKFKDPPEMDVAMLPEAFAAYVRDQAIRMQVPPEMIATSLLISFGSLIGKKVAIQPKNKDTGWMEFPNLWGVSILPPGMLKTPALEAGLKFLHRLESAASLEFNKQMSKWDAEKKLRDIDSVATEKKIQMLIKEGRVAEAEKIAHQAAAIRPPVRQRYLINDATPEARLIVLAENPNGCMQVNDELDGHISQLRKDGYEAARAQELQFFDGKHDYQMDRVVRGQSYVEGPRLSMYGNLQPSKVEKYLEELKRSGNDDGYLQRLFQLGIQPKLSSEYKLVDTPPDTMAIAQVERLFDDVNKLPLSKNCLTGRIEPRVVRFTEAAQEAFNSFLIALEAKLRKGSLKNPQLAAHWGKYRGTMAKLCLIVALAEDSNCLVIDMPAFEKAAALLDYYRQHAQRIYASISREDVASAHELFKRIERGELKDGFNPREDVLRRAIGGLQTSAQVEAGLRVLEEYGWVKVLEVATAGRSKRLVRLNPNR